MKNPKLLGALCLAVPPIVLSVAMSAYAISSFVSSSLADSAAIRGEPASVESALAAGAVVNTILGFVGVLGVIGLFVGVPLGIYLLTRKEDDPTVKHDERSGKHEQSTFPTELAGWSWGGFMLTWIWGLGNSVWLSLLVFLPICNIVMPFVLGVRGKEWAWGARRWASVEEFRRVQKTWDTIGLIMFGCTVLLFLFFVVVIVGTAGARS